TSPSFLQENFRKEVPKFFIPHLFKEADLCGGEFELRLKNQLNQRAIAHECSEWVKNKVVFKSNRHPNQPMNGMIHVANAPESEFVWSNINSFTTTDLGITSKKGFPTLIQRSDFPNAKAYLEWFDQVWENEDDLEEVTGKIQDYF